MAGVLTINLVYQRARTDEVDRIKVLNVCGSSLQDIDVLRQVKNLEVLSLAVNDIENLQPLGEMFNLRELYLRQNSVRDLQQVLHLRRLKRLQILNLSQNPICRDSHYRRFVIASLPSLIELDEITITPEERRAASQTFSEILGTESELSGGDSDNDNYEKSRSLGDDSSSRLRGGYHSQNTSDPSRRRIFKGDGGRPGVGGASSGRPLSRDTSGNLPPSYHQDPGASSRQHPYQSQLRRSSSDPPRYIPKAAGRGRGGGGAVPSPTVPSAEDTSEGGPSEAGVIRAIKVLCSELSPGGISDVLRFVQSLDSY